jgi:hypothetical protein
MQDIGVGTIQWRCGVCNAAKPVGTGGICVRCKKFACNRHLNSVLVDEKKKLVCSRCLATDDKIEKGLLKRFFGRLTGN